MAVCRHRLSRSMDLEEWESLMDDKGCCRECGAVMDEMVNLRAQLREAQEERDVAQETVVALSSVAQERDEAWAKNVELAAALRECQRLAIERVKTADAAVKKDIYAADALMGIAVVARAALSGEGKVWEQVEKALEGAPCQRLRGFDEPCDELPVRQRCPICAALAAMKGE